MNKYLAELDYWRALLTQSASNLSGLAHDLHDVIPRVRVTLERDLGEKYSSEALASHPIVQLYVYHMAFLSHGVEPFGFAGWDQAYEACTAGAGELAEEAS